MTALTESFLRGRIAETITPNETPPFNKDVSIVPEQTQGYITISPDTSSEEIFFYNGVTGTPGSAGEITITSRGYNKDDSSTSVGNQREHSINAEFKGALNHIIINNKPDFADLISTANGEGASYVGVEDVGGWFTGTNLEAVLQELGAGAPGVADASEITAGKVELATQAQYDARDTVGETGAPLMVQMDQLPVSATETTEGLVERATDAEATTGTDTTRYITPKQGKDNYEVIYPGTTVTYFSDAGGSTTSPTFVTLASYTATVNGIYRVQYSGSHGNNFSGTVRAIVDNIPLGGKGNLAYWGCLYDEYNTSDSSTLYGEVALGIGQTISFQGLSTNASISTSITGITIKGDR